MKELCESGIPWIGKIPSTWKLVQVNKLFSIGRGRVIPQTELMEKGLYPVYSSQTKNNGCLGYIDSYDFDIEQLTWTTDGANAGTVFLRSGKHNCTNVCGTLQPKSDNINLHFQKYALEHITFFHKRVDTNGYKIMNNEMAAIHTVLPPINEQNRIATILDSKCSQIDDIITRQKKIIEKLKEYKLSIITEAITKGLSQYIRIVETM
jgi:type I restriction enzyme S subunit